jgi:hypothetical protein
LNEIKAIDDHIFGIADTESRLLFEANLILHAPLRQNLALQQKVYKTVQQYGRKQLKAEIEAVHQKLLNQPDSLMQKLMRLFYK